MMKAEIIGPLNPNRNIPELLGTRKGRVGFGYAEIITESEEHPEVAALKLDYALLLPITKPEFLGFMSSIVVNRSEPVENRRRLGFDLPGVS